MLSSNMNYVNKKEILNRLLQNKKGFKRYHSSELARTLKEVYLDEGKEQFLQYIKRIPQRYLGETLLELPEYIKYEALEELTVKELACAVGGLDSDDAADLMQDIKDVSYEKEQQILSKLDDEDAREIEALNLYTQEQAGSLMQTELFDANIDEPIKNAIKRLKELKNEGNLENTLTKVFLNR